MQNHTIVILSRHEIEKFQHTILNYYQKEGRSFAWRNEQDPYKIVVSEVMLQQTQTFRVAPKYEAFILRFPDFASLAAAPLRDVLTAWQGLGYNRRGIALQKIAQKVVDEFSGNLPQDPEILVTFPGIGKATAASICAFAFNKPTVFVETNIRAVFIHFFFQGLDDITDKQILALVQQTLHTTDPRQWYYALMDYGVMLKKNIPNPSRKSAHHVQQSKFEGSHRQVRGMILKSLLQIPSIGIAEFEALLQRDQRVIEKALDELMHEGFVVIFNNHVMLR